MTPLRAEDLLALPVRLHGIPLGRPVDVLLDRDEPKAIGLDVLCGDEVHRFLPLATATIGRKEIAIRSPFVLLEEDELAFYRARGRELASLRGAPVERGGRVVGTLTDLEIGADGLLVQLVVDTDGKEERVPFDATVRFPESRSAA